MGDGMRRVAKALCALRALAMILAGISSSADAEPAPEVDAWQFELAPYVWVPQVDGRVTAGVRVPAAGVAGGFLALPTTVTVNESGLLGGSAQFQARKRRMTLFLDATGTSFDTVGHLGEVFGDATSAKVHGDLALVEVGTAYRIVEWRFAARALRSVWLEGLAGGRYVHLANDLQVSSSVSSGLSLRRAAVPSGNVRSSAGSAFVEGKVDADVADPFIGGRWSVGFRDDLAWLFSGDVGGFGAGTKRTWQIVSMLRYRLPRGPRSRPVWVSAGYHLIDLDERGEKLFGRDTRIDLEFRGPIVGLGMQF